MYYYIKKNRFIRAGVVLSAVIAAYKFISKLISSDFAE